MSQQSLFEIAGITKEPKFFNPELPRYEIGVQRIHECFERATNNELDQGLAWYENAHVLASQMAKDSPYGINTSQAAGILAALSPNESWPQNIVRAQQLSSSGSTSGPAAFVNVAIRILHGEDPRELLFEPHRNNQKVRNFYLNIDNPVNPDAVTIDRHARAMISNVKSGTLKGSTRVGEYEAMANMFKEVASDRKVSPNQAQAVTWLAWRRMCDTVFLAESAPLTTPTLFLESEP